MTDSTLFQRRLRRLIAAGVKPTRRGTLGTTETDDPQAEHGSRDTRCDVSRDDAARRV
jgi:hypothetical protein